MRNHIPRCAQKARCIELAAGWRLSAIVRRYARVPSFYGVFCRRQNVESDAASAVRGVESIVERRQVFAGGTTLTGSRSPGVSVCPGVEDLLCDVRGPLVACSAGLELLMNSRL